MAVPSRYKRVQVDVVDGDTLRYGGSEFVRKDASKPERMSWEFAGIDGEPFMRLEPITSDLCYQMSEYVDVRKKDGTTVREWRKMDLYPHSLEGGVRYVIEYMMRRQGGATKDVREMEKAVRKAGEAIQQALIIAAKTGRRNDDR